MEQEWVIRAPSDGIITGIQKRQGEMIGSSDSVVTLTENALEQGRCLCPSRFGYDLFHWPSSQYPFPQSAAACSKPELWWFAWGRVLRSCLDMISQLQLHRLGGLGIPILIEVPGQLCM